LAPPRLACSSLRQGILVIDPHEGIDDRIDRANPVKGRLRDLDR